MAKSLQQQIDAGVREALARLGLQLPGAVEQDDEINIIPFGSPGHRQFLGLIIVDEDDDPTGFVTYTSKETGTTYRLEDELGVLMHHPGVDPDKAALMVLRGKVNVFESDGSEVPANAPLLWQPVDQFTVLVGGRR
jgi:hypothetical protein